MLQALILAQRTTIAFDFSLPAILAIIAGIVILIFPQVLAYIIAAYLIIIGVIDLFNINI